MTGKLPLIAACVACRHSWIALYLPMEITKAARAMQAAHCPMCGASSSDIRIRSPGGK